MLGVIWPDVRDRFGQSLGALGTVSLVYGIARMSTSGAGRAATQRFGISACFLTALGGLVVADLVMAGASSWSTFLVGAAAIGVVSGLLDSVGAGVIANLGDVGSAGLILGFYGVGATMGPLIVAVVPDWRWSLVAASAIAAGALTIAYIARSSWPDPTAAAAAATTETGTQPSGRPPLRGTAISLLSFFAFVALEVTFGNWLFTYLTEARSFSDTVAAIGVSGFWGGSMMGRIALVSPRIRSSIDRIGLPIAATAGAVGLGVVVVAPGFTVVVATTLVGLALAPIIPTLSARTALRVGPDHAQQVSGWQLLAANVGAISLPWLTGRLIDATEPAAIMVVALVVFAFGLPILVVARPDRPTPA